MSKSDAVKLAEISANEERFVRICDLIKAGIYGIVILALIIGSACVAIAALKVPDKNLNAFAKCIVALHLNDIVEYLTIGFFGGGWYLEHRRCNRLVRKLGKYRHDEESADAVNTRSGLDETGATPRN